MPATLSGVPHMRTGLIIADATDTNDRNEIIGVDREERLHIGIPRDQSARSSPGHTLTPERH